MKTNKKNYFNTKSNIKYKKAQRKDYLKTLNQNLISPNIQSHQMMKFSASPVFKYNSAVRILTDNQTMT